MSKGSNRRPQQVSGEQFAENWNTIFIQNKAVAEAKASTSVKVSSLSVPTPQGKEDTR